jgi:Kef-type K+ transport system membrane component KefB
MTVLAAGGHDVLLATLLLDLALITGCALVLGALAQRIGQAVVVGEIAAGLALGPSLLGLLPGHLDTLLFPDEVRPYLQSLAGLALVLFMFGVGFEVDIQRLRRSGSVALRVASASILVPALGAVALAPVLWAAHPPRVSGIGGLQFWAFLAIVLSITALPVLARVLAEAGLGDTRVGTLALAIAALTDLVAWVALAALVATLGAGALPLGAVIASLAGLLVILILVVRPLLRCGLAGRWCERCGPAGGSLLLLVALALCAAATTRIGLHPAFGAFAMGLACPRRARSPAANRAVAAVAPDPATSAAGMLGVAGVLLVPLYFAVTGLNVDLTSIGRSGLLEVAGVLAVATGAKIIGAGWAAARCGLDRGSSLGLGLLLNTRGLTELIMLDIGRTAGLIDERLFSVLVLAAVLMTAMTMPLLPLALRAGTLRRARRPRRLAMPTRASPVTGATPSEA